MDSRTCITLLTLVPALLTVAPQAQAAQTTVSIGGKTLKIRDSSSGSPLNGDFDNLISVKVKPLAGVVYIADEAGEAIPGPGCTAGPGIEPTAAGNPEDLFLPNWTSWQVQCPTANLKRLDINAGPGDDVVYVLLSNLPLKIVGGAGADDLEYGTCPSPPFHSTAKIDGGLGDDYLVGGDGDDTISGGAASTGSRERVDRTS